MKRSTSSSTRSDIFVDTSGFYALLVTRDRVHARAREILARAKKTGRRFTTTDYVLDETATLLSARGVAHVAKELFDTIFASKVCRILWMDPDRFDCCRSFFLDHQDKEWSFTDCSSFCAMHELGLRDALTTDHHFAQAKFSPLLLT